MLRRILTLALVCFATNAGAVAFAEVQITHITRGTYLLSDPAHQTITFSSDTNEVLASVTAGPPPNLQKDENISFSGGGPPVGTVNFIELTYVLTAWDDGLIASGPLSNICSSSTPVFCVTSFTGHEVAGAQLVVWFVDGRLSLPPGTFVSPAVVSLHTDDDAVADRFTSSGIARAEVSGPLPPGGPLLLSAAYAYGDGSAVAPVPEPETWALLLGGLALLGSQRRRINRAP